MPGLVDLIVWKETRSSLSCVPVVRVCAPEGTVFPAVGVWQFKRTANQDIYTLDTSRPMGDGWLAWAAEGRLLRAAPQSGLWLGGQKFGNARDIADLLVGYVRSGTSVSLAVGYRLRQRLDIKFLAPGESRPARAKDFAAE